MPDNQNKTHKGLRITLFSSDITKQVDSFTASTLFQATSKQIIQYISALGRNQKFLISSFFHLTTPGHGMVVTVFLLFLLFKYACIRYFLCVETVYVYTG